MNKDIFLSKVKKTNACWLWTGAVNKAGYGVTTKQNRAVGAHRVSYELFVGKLQKGLVLDHLCRNPICVNPQHLEQVTYRTNVIRGVSPCAKNANKTHCKRGHELKQSNCYIRYRNGHINRNCKICHNENGKKLYRRFGTGYNNNNNKESNTMKYKDFEILVNKRKKQGKRKIDLCLDWNLRPSLFDYYLQCAKISPDKDMPADKSKNIK